MDTVNIRFPLPGAEATRVPSPLPAVPKPVTVTGETPVCIPGLNPGDSGKGKAPRRGGGESAWAGLLCASLAVPSLLQAGGGTYHERAAVPWASPASLLCMPLVPCAYPACTLCLPSTPKSLKQGWEGRWKRPHLCSSCSKSQGMGQPGRNWGSAPALCSLGSSPRLAFHHGVLGTPSRNRPLVPGCFCPADIVGWRMWHHQGKSQLLNKTGMQGFLAAEREFGNKAG